MRLITNKVSLLPDIAGILIRNAEGYSPIWYQDNMGNDTIGYGFKAGGIAQKYNLGAFQTMSIADADEILLQIISEIIASLRDKLEFLGKLTLNQRAVLVDMAYNLGLKQFYTFNTFLAYLEKEQIDNAIADLTNTLWYKQVQNRAIRDCLNMYIPSTRLYLI